jgi:intracellular septation protein
MFMQWKVTIVYGFFSFALAYSQFFTTKPLVQSILENRVKLSSTTWYRLNTAWIIFFFMCGLINAFVACQFSEDIWVNFKVFGLTSITLIFSIFSGIYLWWSIKRSCS